MWCDWSEDEKERETLLSRDCWWHSVDSPQSPKVDVGYLIQTTFNWTICCKLNLDFRPNWIFLSKMLFTTSLKFDHFWYTINLPSKLKQSTITSAFFQIIVWSSDQISAIWKIIVPDGDGRKRIPNNINFLDAHSNLVSKQAVLTPDLHTVTPPPPSLE